jgi:putative transposase
MKSFKALKHCKFSCKYHVIWCPKYRRKVLVGKIAERLKSLLETRAVELNAEILEMEIMPDHVHLVLDTKPTDAIGTIIGRLKGYTSKHLREEFPELRRRLPTLWTNSYFASTVGGVTLSVLKKYIENQKDK